MLIMDHMDIDQVLDVPDTPDRLAAQNITERSGLEKQNSSFKFGHFGQGNLFSEERKNCLKNCDRAQIHPPRGFSRPGKSGHHVNSVVFDSGDSSSSRNGPIFRKKVADKGLNYENKDSDHLPYIHNRKSFLTSQSSAGRDSAVVDLTDHNGRAPLLKKAFPSRAPGVTRAELADGYSSYSTEDSPLILKEGNEGRQLNNADKVDSSLDCVKQDDNNNAAQPNAQRNDSVILNSISVPRATRQKRLVRNGCISPLNIAKGKQPVEKDNSGSTGMRQSDSVPVASNASTSLIDFRDIVAEDYNSRSSKGKGLLNHPLSMNGRSTHKPSRNSLSINEKASESGDASRDGVRNFEESSGWRTTHTQSRKLNPPVSRQGQHISIEDSGSSFVSRCNGNTVMRREHEDNARRIHENSNGQISDASAPFSNTRGCHMAKNTLVKRHKQGSTSSSNAECSRSTADDSDIMFFGSLGQTTNSRLTENQNHNGVRITESVIDIDEASPEVRRVRSRGIGCSGGSEDATATQVELDEMLARELQEQFYNEDPAVGSGEIDAHMALALQQEEESHHAVSRRRQPVRNPGGRSYPNLPHTGARAPSSSRITRLRSRFPGQPRTLVPSRGRNSTILPAREGNSLFPTDMDVDMRMHILEALESFSGMVDSSFLQMHRDFNENDYESLLALDENNHQHTGATTRQITGLPQSTVQSNNLEEACAICLENPTVGDIIRHLPCLHKFHKDCIDPWLRRRTSCPVCKSSIT